MEIIVALSSKIFPRNCKNLLSLRWCVKNWKSKPLAVAGLYQLSSFLAETPPSNNNLKALGSVYGWGFFWIFITGISIFSYNYTQIVVWIKFIHTDVEYYIICTYFIFWSFQNVKHVVMIKYCHSTRIWNKKFYTKKLCMMGWWWVRTWILGCLNLLIKSLYGLEFLVRRLHNYDGLMMSLNNHINLNNQVRLVIKNLNLTTV